MSGASARSYGIMRHHNNYWQPVLQDYVMRILWMVPVYSITCWVELIFFVGRDHHDLKRFAAIPEAVRQFFEAYTIYNFFSYTTTLHAAARRG